MLYASTSLLAPAANHRHSQDVGVESKRPVPNVIGIMLQTFFHAGEAAPSMNLCIPGDSASDTMAKIVAAIFLAEGLCELRAFGPRADQTHVATQDVPELRKFIEPESPQMIAEAGATRIVGYGPYRTEIPLGVEMHGPEFDDLKWSPVEADSRLTIQNRRSVEETDYAGDNEKQWRKQDHRRSGCNEIDEPL
jgi:hypothetical protein